MGLNRGLSFKITGKAIPMGRPKFGKGHVYTPARSKAWRETVQWRTKQELGPLRQLLGPLSVALTIYVAKQAGDADNYAKALLDSWNGVLYSDDRQVQELSVFLRRCKPGEEHVQCAIVELDMRDGRTAK